MGDYEDKRAAGARSLIVIGVYQASRCDEVYGVAPCTAALSAGNECYNTRFTCQDAPNFNETTKDLKFTVKDGIQPAQDPAAPLTYRPLLVKLPLESPAIINPKTGETSTQITTLTFWDEPDNDIGQDPYFATRSYDALSQGTFWDKELARNPYYLGRTMIVKRGFDDMLEADYNSSYLVIEGVSKTPGKITFKLKDPLKAMDKRQIPEATTGKLDGAVTASDAVITLTNISQYNDPAVTLRDEWIRSADSIIKYTAIAGNTMTGCVWGQFGSATENLDDGEDVQQCFAAVNENGADIIHRVLNESGYEDSLIDVAGLEADRDQWLTGFVFTGVISEPLKSKEALAELCLDTMSNIYWDTQTQKITMTVFAPPAPLDDFTTIADADIVSIKTDNNEADRITEAQMNYARTDGAGPADEQENFGFRSVIRDLDAEAPEKHGSRVVDKRFSRWITSASIADFLNQKRMARFVNPPKKLIPVVEIKDSAINPGDIIGITTSEFADVTGAPVIKKQVQVISSKNISPGRYEYTTMDAAFKAGGSDYGKYGFIAPAGQPDWDAASDFEKKYAYIGNNDNQLGALLEEGFFIW